MLTQVLCGKPLAFEYLQLKYLRSKDLSTSQRSHHLVYHAGSRHVLKGVQQAHNMLLRQLSVVPPAKQHIWVVCVSHHRSPCTSSLCVGFLHSDLSIADSRLASRKCPMHVGMGHQRCEVYQVTSTCRTHLRLSIITCGKGAEASVTWPPLSLRASQVNHSRPRHLTPLKNLRTYWPSIAMASVRLKFTWTPSPRSTLDLPPLAHTSFSP